MYEIELRNTSGINVCGTSISLQHAPAYENLGLSIEPKLKTCFSLNTNKPFLLSPSTFVQFTKLPESTADDCFLEGITTIPSWLVMPSPCPT